MAGGARGGTSKLIGMPAVYFGIGIMCLGVFFYSFVTIRMTMRHSNSIRIVAWVSGLLTLTSWALMGIVLGNR
jgi:cytochrome c oxidase assembly factor CtaG